MKINFNVAGPRFPAKHDVLVIGGGLAGWRAAEAAVQVGASVALAPAAWVSV